MTTFTLEEAEALLPKVREILLRMRHAKAQIDEIRGELGDVAGRATGNGHVVDADAVAEKRRRAESLVDMLNQDLSRMQEWGVEVKSVDEGLVDFPSEREGRIVYLCWRLGEEHIGWWHETWTGFAGRQPL